MSERLNCKEVSRLLSDGLDKDIAATERARLRLHLVICEACRNVDQQMALLRRAMRRLSRPDDDGRDGSP
jgi:predicted anti-sigma-YlaC factor YlaD